MVTLHALKLKEPLGGKKPQRKPPKKATETKTPPQFSNEKKKNQPPKTVFEKVEVFLFVNPIFRLLI